MPSGLKEGTKKQYKCYACNNFPYTVDIFLLSVLSHEHLVIQLCALYNSELKMTEELSKHVFKKCRICS